MRPEARQLAGYLEPGEGVIGWRTSPSTVVPSRPALHPGSVPKIHPDRPHPVDGAPFQARLPVRHVHAERRRIPGAGWNHARQVCWTPPRNHLEGSTEAMLPGLDLRGTPSRGLTGRQQTQRASGKITRHRRSGSQIEPAKTEHEFIDPNLRFLLLPQPVFLLAMPMIEELPGQDTMRPRPCASSAPSPSASPFSRRPTRSGCPISRRKTRGACANKTASLIAGRAPTRSCRTARPAKSRPTQPYIMRVSRLGALAAERGKGFEFVRAASHIMWSGEVEAWHDGGKLAACADAVGLPMANATPPPKPPASTPSSKITKMPKAAAGHWRAALRL